MSENESIHSVAALQLSADGAARERREEVAVEAPFAIQLAGETLAITMRTPGHDAELTAGFLLSEGHDPRGTAAARVVKRGTLSSAACGVCGRDDIEELVARLSAVPAETSFQRAALARAMQRLPEHQPIFARTGGLHAAALVTTTGDVTIAREDVGRHNAVDKVLGRAALDGLLPLSGYFLAVSGRTSFEIVQKAVAAGVPAVVAISAPSSLAVELAERFRVLLVGFARGGNLTVYAGRFRLEGA
ncbi:MAG TPA: formate dehydrogenase accessory sulfurtransferase FdhD [Polyangiaceae bacterium]|nr:formate dehydrogenase accessory sulfurtransferase FdhD [Polyangiaceae bacterium]